MSENKKTILIIVIGVLMMISITVYSNHVSWKKEEARKETERKLAVGIKGKLKIELQAALDEYIEKNKDRPSVFADFVSYAENKSDKSTIDLNKFSEGFLKDEPVKGLDTKTLVIKIKETKENKEESVVFLLNNSFVTLANI